jgi:hypothetical protein
MLLVVCSTDMNIATNAGVIFHDCFSYVRLHVKVLALNSLHTIENAIRLEAGRDGTRLQDHHKRDLGWKTVA